MSIGLKRRDVLQLFGAGALSMALPGRLQAAQKETDGKQAKVRPLTLYRSAVMRASYGRP